MPVSTWRCVGAYARAGFVTASFILFSNPTLLPFDLLTHCLRGVEVPQFLWDRLVEIRF